MADFNLSSSRLSKREKKRLTRQSLTLLALAIVLGLLFIFLVVPGLIRVWSWFRDSGLTPNQGDQIAPSVPVVAAPPTATHSAQVRLEGFAESNSQVILWLNGQETSKIKAEADGKFEVVADLTEGENLLRLMAEDAAHNRSEPSREYKILFDQTSPVITISQPTDGQQFELRTNQLLNIKGQTEPQAKIYVNDRLVFTKNDGSFNTNFQLQEGDNQLKIKAVDLAGNQTEQALTVKFRF